jgi:GNAT superfamily N-acetyltransferase
MPVTSDGPVISVVCARNDEDFETLRTLFISYQQHINIDLGFQGFERELATLAAVYAEPSGGAFIAKVNDVPAGCCAFRPLTDVDYDNACEMKRLYVLPAFRGFGLGQLLIERTMTEARLQGYHHMLLDTLDEMETARALYQGAGFVEVAPYYYTPLPGTHYLAAEL